METFVKGDVVVIPFPFSDLSDSKRRPALVVAKLRGDNVILCQITSQKRIEQYNIDLQNKDFTSGGLSLASYVRADMLFTGNTRTIIKRAGRLNKTKILEVVNKIKEIIEG